MIFTSETDTELTFVIFAHRIDLAILTYEKSKTAPTFNIMNNLGHLN